MEEDEVVAKVNINGQIVTQPTTITPFVFVGLSGSGFVHSLENLLSLSLSCESQLPLLIHLDPIVS